MKTRKTFLGKLVLPALLAITLVMAGCNKNETEIKNLCDDLTALEGRVEILETFYKWANEYGIEEHDADLQRQIDELRKAFEEGGVLMDGGGRFEELERRLNQLIAGSTLTIADIADKLDDQDDALADLYEKLDGIEAGDISDLLERVVALERVSEAMNGEIDDIWEALDLLSETDLSEIIDGLEELETDLEELQEMVDSLEEQVAALLKKFIKNISFVPDHSDGKIPVDVVDNAGVLTAQPFTAKYLVTPTSGATAIAAVFSSSDVFGHLNQVATTRALVGTVPVTSVAVGTGAESDVLIVTYEGGASIPVPTDSDKELQIALRVILDEESEDMAGDIASEFAPLKFSTIVLPPIELTDFTQDDKDVDAVTSAPTPSDAPVATTPAGEVAYIEGGLTLDVKYDTNADYPRLINPVTTYAVEGQWEYIGGAWEPVNPLTAELDGSNELTVDASANHGKVAVKMTIADDNGFNRAYYFFVDVPATLVDLSTMEFEAYDLDPLTRALGGDPVQLLKLATYDDHTTWEGAHAQWDGDIDVDQHIHLNFKTQLEAAFPEAENVTVAYEIAGMLDESAAQHFGSGSTKNDPELVVAAGNAKIHRNNTGATAADSNHDLYLIVKATYNADNAVEELTHYFCFLMTGCVPAPDAIEDMDDTVTDLGYVVKTADDIVGASEDTYGQLWNDPLGGKGNTVYDATNVASFPDGGKLDIEEQLEDIPEYAGVDFTVTYTIMGQYRWTGTGKESERDWVLNQTDQPATIDGNTIKKNINNTVDPGNNEFGDRLVIKVEVSAVDKADPTNEIEVDPSVFYICVALP
jgi:uncharacterized coiled-coil protein SlyX